MNPRRVVLDTNVIIRYGWEPRSGYPLLSAVVLQELAAGASSETDLRALDRVRRQYEGDDRVVLPMTEDWYFAGKILSLLWRGQKSRRSGNVSAIPKQEQLRLLRDVLIARSAKRIGATVVTEDLGDYEKIRRYCDVRVVHPSAYF